MASLQGLMTDSKNYSKSSLVYMLLLSNILAISIFLEKNMGLYSKIKSMACTPDSIQNKKPWQSSKMEELPFPVSEGNKAGEEIKETLDEVINKSYKIDKETNYCHDSESEKVIDFREAIKEIKNKEYLKEVKETLREPKESMKTLVWHFPKATSKR